LISLLNIRSSNKTHNSKGVMMIEFLYPTRYENGWIEDMISDWKKSNKPFMSFYFHKFYPRTLPPKPFEPFWIYFYYSHERTERPHLSGKILYRVNILDYNESGYFNQTDVSIIRFSGVAKIWFKCDKFEEIKNANGALLNSDNFRHIDPNKKLLSTIRSSIAPVKRLSQITVVSQYP
jgi:hypothetical protein